MLAKIISAGALMLLLTGSALADQPYKMIGHDNSVQLQQNMQTSSCKPAFSLPQWQRPNGACPALSGLASGSTINMLQRATWGHASYVRHHNGTQRYATLPAPYGYKDEQGSHALGGGPG
jgi:hypothetical protein